MEKAGVQSRHEGQKSHSLSMAFKQLAAISSTLSSLRRKRRTKGERNDFALTGPEILWLKWPRGSRQIWQSVSFWVEFLVNHSFPAKLQKRLFSKLSYLLMVQLKPSCWHARREVALCCPPAPSIGVGLPPPRLLLIFSSHLRLHCWDCFTWKDKKTTETWSCSVEIRTW